MEESNLYHYYGDRIRGLFFVTGIIMAITLPLFSKLIDIPVTVSIIAMMGLAVLGGFLNPAQKWIIVVDTIVSIFAFLGFEYYAVHTYLTLPLDVPINVYFYWVTQIFALLFFIAVYLSVKTLRGKILAKK